MRKLAITLSLAFIGVLAMNQNVQAQENYAGIGLEVALPIGDLAETTGIGFGATAGYELGLSDQFAIGANVGFIYMTGAEEDYTDPFTGVTTTVENDPTNLIPLQAYARYYFDESRTGLFASAKVGVHLQMYTVTAFDPQTFETTEETETNTNFSAAPEIGYFLTENISLALRYQMMFATVETPVIDPVTFETSTEEETYTFGYIGLRAAFNF